MNVFNGHMPKSTSTAHQITQKNIFIYVRMLTARSNHLQAACKCSQRALMPRARGRPVATAFQDLCLGAPLSHVLLLLPLECVAGDATTNRTEQEGTASPLGRYPKK